MLRVVLSPVQSQQDPSMQTMHAMRRLKLDPVSDELIGKILVAGISAPSGADLQTRRFLVVKDPAIKQRGASPASAAPALVSSPVSSRSRVTDPHGPSQSRELPDIVGRPADDRAMPLECGQARSYHRRIVVGPGSVP